MFCSKCGSELKRNDLFCSSCGTRVIKDSNFKIKNESNESNDLGNDIKNIASSVFKKINEMTGETSFTQLNLRDVFSEVFSKHDRSEADKIFISGTSITTPKEDEIASTWPKPWIFLRVFGAMMLVYFLLYICVEQFRNINAVPGLIIVGSFIMPFSLLIFFWETNAPRNISLFNVVKMFFIGGVLSLVLTLFLFEFIEPQELNYTGAIIVGIVEEVGKLLAILFFVRSTKNKYILNGLLIGAAIGAGFAAFESAGYALKFLIQYDFSFMYKVIFTRGFLAAGGHIVWAAITGGALVLVKENQTLSLDHLINEKFLKLFAVPVILHSIWDMPIVFLPEIYFIPLSLTAIAWVFVLTLMNAGLKQISRNHVHTS